MKDNPSFEEEIVLPSPSPSRGSLGAWNRLYENQFSFILKLELINITKISHLDSL